MNILSAVIPSMMCGDITEIGHFTDSDSNLKGPLSVLRDFQHDVTSASDQ